MIKIKVLEKTILLLGLALALSACVPTFNMPVTAPVHSGVSYENIDSSESSIAVTDSRPPEYLFSEGTLNFNIQVNDQDINEITFLTAALEDELIGRGYKVDVKADTEGAASLSVLNFKISNHRSNAYSPLVTFTQFSGDFEINGQITRVASFIKRGKVPVWAITEKGIVENTFNQPISLLVQDLATRIAQLMGGGTISDASVESLVSEINAAEENDKLIYLKVYELGFSNNMSAIPYLASFSEHEDEYIRLAAISGLGLLKAESEVERLITIFNSGKLWQDRGMALKSLADIATTQAQQVVDAEWIRVESLSDPDKEARWNKSILSLYR